MVAEGITGTVSGKYFALLIDMMERSLAGTLGYERYYDQTLSTTLPGPGWDNLYSLINATNLVLKYTPVCRVFEKHIRSGRWSRKS